MRNGYQPTKGKRVTKAPTNTPKGGSAGTKDYKAPQPPVYDYGVFSIDAILPPKDEEIHVNRYGTVLMNVKSLEQILTELPKERKQKILDYLYTWHHGIDAEKPEPFMEEDEE